MPLEEAIQHAQSAPDPVLYALKAAIYTIPEDRLRAYIATCCDSMPDLREAIERDFLVRGEDIVRYHADLSSEEEEEEASSASETEAEDGENANKVLRPIAIRDDEFAPRMAKCLNCEEDFDVTINEKGDCLWHTG